jgi:hypothetical protein
MVVSESSCSTCSYNVHIKNMRLLEKTYKEADIKIEITPKHLSIIMSKIPTQSFQCRKLKVVKGPDNTTIQSDGLKLVFHSFDQSLGSIIGFIDSINGSTTIVRAKGNDGRRSSNVPSSRYCYQTAFVDLTSCTTLSSFIHPLTRAYSDCLTKTQYVLHVTSPVSHLTQIFHSHTFPRFLGSTLCGSQSLLWFSLTTITHHLPAQPLLSHIPPVAL